jgi:hypothetical protein
MTPVEGSPPDLADLHAAALPSDAPGAWIREAIESLEGSPPDWRTMPRTMFDTQATTVQTALIPRPDPADTGDLFDLLEGNPT